MEVLEREGGETGVALALKVVDAAVARELDAVASIHAIHTGSRRAMTATEAEVASWERYGESLRSFILGRAGLQEAPSVGSADAGGTGADWVPRLAPAIRSQVFNMGSFEPAQAYFEEHPGILQDLGLSVAQTRLVENYMNGRRTAVEIRDRIEGWTGESLPLSMVTGYLEVLRDIGWIELVEGGG